MAADIDAFVTKLTRPATPWSTPPIWEGAAMMSNGIAVEPPGPPMSQDIRTLPIPHPDPFQGPGRHLDAFVTKFMDQPPPYLARPLIDYSRALNNPVLTFDSGGQALWFTLFQPPPAG